MTSATMGLPSQPPTMDTMHMRLPSSVSLQNSNLNASINISRRQQKFKLEPMKILEPSSKKLSLPESQRIIYILEELIRQVEMIDYLELVTNNDDKMRQLMHTCLTEEERKRNFEQIFISMCQHHRALAQSYNNSSDSDSASPKNKDSLVMLIKSSCKDILRVLISKPTLFEGVKEEFAKRKQNVPQVIDLLSLFNELRDIIMERLLITPNEQKEKLEYLKELLLREKANNELIKKLREEQSSALADKEKEIQVRNDQIRKLDNDLKNVEKFSSDLVKRTKMEAEQLESSEVKASEGRKSKLLTELNQLRQHFQTLVLEHRETEQQLRKEKLKHEANVEGLLYKYDDEMTKKQDEYDEIEELYEEEKKQLLELEEKFKPLEEEYKKIIEEKRVIEQLRRIEEENLNKKIKAAIVIQSYWRGFKLRKGLFKKGKGKKGKKK